ncbi:sensor histidine kinase [Aquimarina sp. 2201CG5-10]|uniref:sensor histidine kinase n=1 Tax=Aquimarina callyspongiae TaxID=3098150 RepID=UPI002AB484CD|nr:sensor histidine kinase [Aquimarina sp. 2201CG5-10]MDY8135277.1 sensor histidine kinase [Aquimarina sp. 2201CG5-10]
MIAFLKKYASVLYGFIILYIIVQGLIFVEFILIDPKETLMNVVGFLFWGIIISIIVHAILFHRKRKVFYGMVACWVLSLSGFILGRYLDYKVFGVSSFFLFLITNYYILWSWYNLRYKKLKELAFKKAHKPFLIKLLVLFIIFTVGFGIDQYMNIPDNPITFALLTVFWLGVFYILAPTFFQKHRLLILGLYGALLVFFFLFIVSYGDRTHEQNLDVFLIFLFPIPLLILLWLYDQWKWFQTLKADKAKAELALLKQQVNPHFFFNTLNNLYGLAKQKSDQTPDLILKLSDIMRYVIYKGKENEVMLEEEIEYLENYIELQQIRHHEKVIITFNKDIQQKNITITPLLFIILLENAFKHGVDSLIKEAYVNILLEVKDREIAFEVTNNYDASALSESKGIGLENLKKRLEIVYGKSHSLDFTIEKDTYNARLTINI